MKTIEERSILNGYVICTHVDSNKDQGETIFLDSISKSEITFDFGLVVNADAKLDVKKGDTVLYRKSGANMLRHGGTTYFVLKPESIIGY